MSIALIARSPDNDRPFHLLGSCFFFSSSSTSTDVNHCSCVTPPACDCSASIAFSYPNLSLVLLLNSAILLMSNAQNAPPVNIMLKLNALIVATLSASIASNGALMGGRCGSMFVWKKRGRVQLFLLAIALLVIAPENNMNAEPATHIPSCFRDRCDQIDLSSVCDAGGGMAGASAEAMMGEELEICSVSTKLCFYIDSLRCL